MMRKNTAPKGNGKIYYDGKILIDDHEAIQNAINECFNVKVYGDILLGKMYFPDGEYLFNGINDTSTFNIKDIGKIIYIDPPKQ